MTLELAPHGPLFVRTWIERCIMSVLAPVCGTRAVGKALVKAKSADTLLRGGSYAVRVNEDGGGAKRIDFTRVYKVSPATPDNRGEYDCTKVDVTATSAGVEVSMLAMGGGKSHEMPIGAKLMWWPPIAGMEPFLEVTEAITGATDATHPGALRQIVGFNELGLYKANLGAIAWMGKVQPAIPSAVVAWIGTSKGEATTRGKRIREHSFRIFIFNGSLSSADERRGFSMASLDHIEGLLEDRSAVDGQPFSNPHMNVGPSRLDVAEDTSYVHVVDTQVSNTIQRIESRQYIDWLQTQTTFLSTATAEYPDIAEALGFPDVKFNMQQ
jgi:hypothetical protein